jgi:histidine phosphotransferase ChpT
VLLPKNQVKLLLNLVVIAITAVPRGGRIAVTATGEGSDTRFVIEAAGVAARIPAEVEALVAGAPPAALDAHAIQPFFTGCVARACAMSVAMAAEDGRVTITAAQQATAPA